MASALSAPIHLGSAGSGSGSGIPITTPATEHVLVGQSILIVVALSDLTRTVTSVVDDNGNTYTILGPWNGTSQRFYLCYTTILYPAQQLLGGSNITVNKTSATYATAAKAMKVGYGLKKTSMHDLTSPVGSGTSTSPLSGSTGTLGQADELLVGAIASNSTSAAHTSTINSPFTALGSKIFQSGIDLHAGYQIVTSNAAQTVSGTLSTSRAWGALVIAFRAGVVPDTLQFGAVSLEADMLQRNVQAAQTMLEIDYALSDVRVAGILFEADVTPEPPPPAVSGRRPLPQIVS